MVQTRSMARTEGHPYEFGGPLGVSLITLGLPFACYLAAFICNDATGCPAPSVLHPSTLSLDKLKQDVHWPGFSGLFSLNATLAVLGHYAFNFFLWVALPAYEVQGTKLRTGGRLNYRLNAFSSTITTLAIAAAGTALQGSSFVLWTFIWDNYVQILTANLIISFFLAIFVYVRSFSVKPNGGPDNRELAVHGVSGNLIYDWFIGRELNPPVTIPLVGTVDIKSYMELRPGFVGWMLLNSAFVARQHYHFGKITDSMVLVYVSQALYALDALYVESNVLTTIDITTDGFGFMLAFGDLVWLPFTYSLQARYLAVYPLELGGLGVVGVLSVLGLGFIIYRLSNSQKNLFRTNPQDPAVANLEYITTKTGSRLLVGGWWGRARHINYLGDWLLSWAYCLPTGIAGYVVKSSSAFHFKPRSDGFIIRDRHSLTGGKEVFPGEAKGWGMLITYFFMLYFAILLIHRERRDEEKCKNKYGRAWLEYCRQVPSRILPGIY